MTALPGSSHSPKGIVQHQERTRQLGAPFARKWRMRWTTWLPHPHRAPHRSQSGFTSHRLAKLRHIEPAWNREEKQRVLLADVQQNWSQFRDCLCNKLSRFCHGWSQQPAQLPWTPCDLSSFLPTGICYHDTSCLSLSPTSAKPRSPTCSQLRLLQLCKCKTPAWNIPADSHRCAHVCG